MEVEDRKEKRLENRDATPRVIIEIVEKKELFLLYIILGLFVLLFSPLDFRYILISNCSVFINAAFLSRLLLW